MHVTLYTKPGCHLCEMLKPELLDLQNEFGFELHERNILEDEALHSAYRLVIPVVEIVASSGGTEQRVRLQAPVNQLELRRQIKDLATRTQPTKQA